MATVTSSTRYLPSPHPTTQRPSRCRHSVTSSLHGNFRVVLKCHRHPSPHAITVETAAANVQGNANDNHQELNHPHDDVLQLMTVKGMTMNDNNGHDEMR